MEARDTQIFRHELLPKYAPPPLPRRLYSSDVCRALVPVGLSSLVFSSSRNIWQTPHFHDAIHYASLCIFVRMHIQRLTHVEQDGVQQENLLGCGALPHPGSFCTSAMRAPRRAYGPAKTSNLLTYSGMLSLFLPFLLYFFLCLNFLHFSPLLPSTFSSPNIALLRWHGEKGRHQLDVLTP